MTEREDGAILRSGINKGIAFTEHCLEIRPDFEDRAMFVSQLIEFCWNVKVISVLE